MAGTHMRRQATTLTLAQYRQRVPRRLKRTLCSLTGAELASVVRVCVRSELHHDGSIRDQRGGEVHSHGVC